MIHTRYERFNLCKSLSYPARACHAYIHTYIHTYIHEKCALQPLQEPGLSCPCMSYIHTYIHTHIHTYMKNACFSLCKSFSCFPIVCRGSTLASMHAYTYIQTQESVHVNLGKSLGCPAYSVSGKYVGPLIYQQMHDL